MQVRIARAACIASRTRGVKSSMCPRMLPPSEPVTSSQSPGLPPDRVSGLAAVDVAEGGDAKHQRPVVGVRVAAGECDVELSGQRQACLRKAESPSSSAERSGAAAARGSASEINAASGWAAIAARSLRLAASACRPIRCGSCLPSWKSTRVGEQVGRDDDFARGRRATTSAASSLRPSFARGSARHMRREAIE